MKNWIKDNWFKLIIVLLFTIIVVVYYLNSNSSFTYKMNIACADEASEYIKKENSNDVFRYNILQNYFNKVNGSCYIEYSSMSSVTGIAYYIYDLTHNKLVTDLQSLKTYGDSGVYTNFAKEYQVIKNKLLLD